MIMHADTGCLALPELGGVLLSPTLSRTQFLRSPALSAVAPCVVNAPWCSYRLPDIPQADTEVGIVVQFHGERLMWLCLCHEAARFGQNWSDWSRERERDRERFHEHWLRAVLGVLPGRYDWGEIASRYDECGGCSAITIRYGCDGGSL